MSQQQKYLQQMVVDWRNRERDKIGGPYSGGLWLIPKTPSVLRAERISKRCSKIISRWEKKANAVHKKRMSAIEATCAKARKIILFSEPKDALRQIERLLK